MKRCFLFLLLLFAVPGFAATGRVAGQVITKTTGQGAAGALVEIVRIFQREDGTVGSDILGKIKSDSGGRFAFGPFPASDKTLLLAQVQWQGFPYEELVFDGTGHMKRLDPLNVRVAVYNATRQAPPLFFRVHHVAIESKDRSLKVTERIVVENPSRETFIGDESGATVKLDLPAGAKDVALDAKVGGKLVHTGDGYAFAKPITPAEYQPEVRRNAIILTYTLDWPRSAPWNRKLDLSHKILYPTNFFFVARNPDDHDLQLEAPQLGHDETQQIPVQEGQPVVKVVNAIGFPMAQQPALRPGETVSLALVRPVNPLVWAFVMFIGALIGIVPLALRGGKNRGTTSAENPYKIKEPTVGAHVLAETRSPISGNDEIGNGFAVSGEANELVFAIARLDEEFARGEMDRETYQKRRAAWKKQLMDLLP